MKNAKKIVALLLCAVLLIGASVAGTLAYLTDSKSAQNTFTVGHVKIKLTENGQATTGLTLLLVPNVPVEKEPVITVLKDSEDCYVRAIVTVDVSKSWTDAATAAGMNFETWASSFANNYLLTDGIGAGFNTANWSVTTPSVSNGTIDTDKHTITYTLTYKMADSTNIVVKSGTDTPLPALFNDVKAPSSLTNDQLALLAGMTIDVEAHAIQADGFDGGAVEAWAAFDA